MNLSVNTLCGQIRRKYKGMVDEGPVIDYINQVHDELMQRLPLYEENVTISLIANTREYSLPERVLGVWQVYTLDTTGDEKDLLIPTSKDELTARVPLWRSEDASNSGPLFFYYGASAGSPKLGIHPRPTSTYITTRPSVLAICSVRDATPLTGASILPYALLTADAYYYGVCAKLDEELGAPLVERERSLQRKEEAIQKEVLNFFARNATLKQRVIPARSRRSRMI